MESFKKAKVDILFILVTLWPRPFIWKRRWRTFLHHLAKQSKNNHHHWWVQVGANDGGDWDPFHEIGRKHSLSSLLIEPVDFLFQQLKLTYSTSKANILIEQVAVGEKEGSLWMDTIDFSDLKGLPGWATKINSLKDGFLKSHEGIINNISDKIIRQQVSVKPLKKILSEHNIRVVDFLEIDTEGYDYVVIQSIDFSKIEIGFLIFEHKHLSKDDHESAIKLLRQNGFEIYLLEYDTIAWPEKDNNTTQMVKRYLSY